MKENKELIKSESSIINKVINFFKSIFWKNKSIDNVEVENNINSEKENESYSNQNENIVDFLSSENIVSEKLLTKEELESRLKTEEELMEESDTEYSEADEEFIRIGMSIESSPSSLSEEEKASEKARILELYKNIKSGKVSIDSVDELDLMIINPLLQEEIRLESEIIEKQILVKKNS